MPCINDIISAVLNIDEVATSQSKNGDRQRKNGGGLLLRNLALSP